jgi:NAD(P)H-hydrate epimerase
MARSETSSPNVTMSLRKRSENARRSFVLSRDAGRAVDRAATEEYGIPGIVLMENAARGLADAAIDMLDRLSKAESSAGSARARHVLIVCGSGNNGGDGYALARHLHNAGTTVTLMPLSEPKSGGDAAINHAICQAMHLREMAVDSRDLLDNEHFDLIVDAIFGTGLDREITGTAREVIVWINERHTPVLAVDVPSGLDCDTGEIHGACIRAAMTCTFVALKPAFQQLDTQKWLGEVRVVDIGAPRELVEHHGQRLPTPPPGVEDARRVAQEVPDAMER